MSIRPFPLNDNLDGFLSKVGSTINNSTLYAGKGIQITRHNNGHLIAVRPEYSSEKLVFAGEFDTKKEYFVNDVVSVNGCNTYYDGLGTGSANIIPYYKDYPTGYTGSYARPYLAAGLFVCIKYVPAVNMDSTMLINTVLPSINGTIDKVFAEQYRHNDLNIYYPIFPVIPSGSQIQVAEETWEVTANDTFWMPLVPYIPTTFCVNGENTTTLVAAYNSTLTFDISKLPYTAP